MRKGTFTKAKLGFSVEGNQLSLLISGLFRIGPTVTPLAVASGFLVGSCMRGMCTCEAAHTVDVAPACWMFCRC